MNDREYHHYEKSIPTNALIAVVTEKYNVQNSSLSNKESFDISNYSDG